VISIKTVHAAAMGMCGLLCAEIAPAQSNSLFNRPPSARQAPASQPAGGMPDVVLGGHRSPAPQRMGEEPPPKNPVLLAASPIAVPPPKPRKFEVNQLINIVVREDKRAVSDAKLKSEKKWEHEWELRKWFRLNPEDHLVAQVFDPPPGADFDYENKYNGTGKVDRTDSLVMRIQAKIIDVKPNGTLVLEASKHIEMDEEEQIMTLTGTCRSEDVTPQNTVLSSQVAGLHIKTDHKGAARDAARRGWLMRALDFLRPF
jgi:flagellar L-ring protein precursor FlgH